MLKNPDSKAVGYPTTGFNIALLNEKNEEIGEGVTGRLAINGAGMFDAYLTPWQLAHEYMCHGWFMTGDLAQRQKGGRIVICGREKTYD